MTEASRSPFADPRDTEIARYRTLSAPAVVGFILGLISPLAAVDPLLCAVPMVGAVFSGLALWRIKRNASVLVGGRLALVGLTLSVFFGTAAMADRLAFRALLHREARACAARWCDFLLQDQPRDAHQLTLLPKRRLAPGETLDDFYREGSNWRNDLDEYVAKAIVAELLELGRQARVDYAGIRYENSTADYDFLLLHYTLRRDGAGAETTHFEVAVRREKSAAGPSDWRISNVDKAGPYDYSSSSIK
ncbi:MAG TPA: hypothetical protein VMY42_23285 [Thermoguttaceae bacterium]|nr:hypothetical protein [Thermoguttaceae bacterium]